MFKKSKITDWIIAGSVAYVAYHAVDAIQTVKAKVEEVSEAIARPAKVVREKFTPKKSTPKKSTPKASETARKISDRVSSLSNRFFNK